MSSLDGGPLVARWRGLGSVLKRVDPCGLISLSEHGVREWKQGPVIAIGGDETAVDCDIRVLPDLWGAQVFPGDADFLPYSINANPIGAMIAGCLVARETFARLSTPTKASLNPYRFSPLGRPRNEEPAWHEGFDLGRCLVIGVGGVGSNLVHFLSNAGILASIMAVDFDTVFFTDLNRCIPFFYEDAVRGAAKVDVVKDRCSRVGFQIDAKRMDFAEFVHQEGRGSFDTWYALANERNVMWSIENNLPPLTWCAATSPNWGVTVSRHVPLRDGCVACLDSLHPARKPDLACADGEIQVAGKNVMGSLPFLSALAASVLAARSLAVAMTGDTTGPNLHSIDSKSPTLSAFTTALVPSADCVCRTLPRELYSQMIGSRVSVGGPH